MRKNYTIKLKRKRKLKTDYKSRLTLLKSQKIRLVIRKSSKMIIAQMVEYETKGDKTLLLVKSSYLKKIGWKYHTRNTPAAYLTGLLLGTKAKKLKINEVVPDLGLQKLTKNSILFATLNGVIDSGIKLPHNEKIIVQKERISGEHIAKNIKGNDKHKFSMYTKIEDITKNFEEVKNKIKNG